jgi:Ca2+-transporting ATPase
MAYAVIYFTRIFVSLSKKVLGKNVPPLCTLSYVSIGVQPVNEGSLHDKPVSFLSVDPKRLNDMVRNNNFEALSQSGGVKALAMVLGTDIKGNISGNVADLIYKKNVYGANKYKKAPAKGFLSYVLKHLRTPLSLYYWPVLYSLCLWYQRVETSGWT